MEIFVIVKKILIILGIHDGSHKYGRFLRVLLSLVTVLVQYYMIVTSGWYLLNVANTFEQRVQSTMIVFAAIYLQILFDVTWLQHGALMAFMESVQRTADQR